MFERLLNTRCRSQFLRVRYPETQGHLLPAVHPEPRALFHKAPQAPSRCALASPLGLAPRVWRASAHPSKARFSGISFIKPARVLQAEARASRSQSTGTCPPA